MTKLASNQNYGRPSPSKLKARLKGWQAWARGMTLRAQVEQEILPKLTALRLIPDEPTE